jgi:hypothetical protein
MHLLLEFRGYDNVIATNNEFQRQEGVPISKDTNLTFSDWNINTPCVIAGVFFLLKLSSTKISVGCFNFDTYECTIAITFM